MNRVGVSRLKSQSLCGDLSQHGSARSCPAFRKKSVTEKLEIVLNEIIRRHYLQNVTADILQIHEDSCIFQCTDVIIITRKGNITISCKVSNCKSFIAVVLLVKFHFNIIHYRMKGQLNCNLLGYFNHIRYIRLSEYQAIRSKFIVLLREWIKILNLCHIKNSGILELVGEMTNLNTLIYTFVQMPGTNLNDNILIIYFVFVNLDSYYFCVKIGKKQSQDEGVIIVVTSAEYQGQLSHGTFIVDKLLIGIHKTPSYSFIQVRSEWKYMDNISTVIIDYNFDQDKNYQNENSNGIRILNEGDDPNCLNNLIVWTTDAHGAGPDHIGANDDTSTLVSFQARVIDQYLSVCSLRCHQVMHDAPIQWSRMFKSRKICVKSQHKLFCDHNVSEEPQKEMSGSFQVQKHEDGIKNWNYLRIIRIYSEEVQREELLSGDYKLGLVTSDMNRAGVISRSEVLKKVVIPETAYRPVCCVQNDLRMSSMNKIIQKYYRTMITVHPALEDSFFKSFIVAYRRPAILREKLIGAELPKLLPSRPKRLMKGMKKCHKRSDFGGCPSCPFSCQIVYCTTCKRCSVQYFGTFKKSLQDGFANYKYYVTNKDFFQANVRHVNSRGHSISDMTVVIVEKVHSEDRILCEGGKSHFMKKFNSKFKRVCGIFKETENIELRVVMMDRANRFTVIDKESWICYIKSNAILRFKKLIRFHGIDAIMIVAIYNNITSTIYFNKGKKENRKTFSIVMYIESLLYALLCSYIGTLRNCYSYICGPSFGDFSEVVSLSGFQKLSHRVISENREGRVKIKF